MDEIYMILHACFLLILCYIFSETCNMAPQNRKNCGWSGITEQECHEKNCCFDSSIRGYPWCFSPLQEIDDNEANCHF
uniref:P-type domain-containing protein n=1 Tax=Sarcophilus harrisii TaxID=9305 RepID=A0A7N4PBP9_SARHA